VAHRGQKILLTCLIFRILKRLEMWPVEYPKPCPVETRASPFDFKPLRKLLDLNDVENILWQNNDFLGKSNVLRSFIIHVFKSQTFLT